MESEKVTEGLDQQSGQDLAALQAEVTKLRERVAELKAHAQLAFCDPLTGLGNRRYLDKRMAEEINRIGRERGATFSVVLIDVDDFKRINDAYGHTVGDETLCWIARFIESSVREHDVCCRFAGDEFVVLLPGADGTSCAQLVERLRQRLHNVRSWSGVPLSLSIGQATHGEDSVAGPALIKIADNRMYSDKRANKTVSCGNTSEAAWAAMLSEDALFADPSLDELSMQLMSSNNLKH